MQQTHSEGPAAGRCRARRRGPVGVRGDRARRAARGLAAVAGTGVLSLVLVACGGGAAPASGSTAMGPGQGSTAGAGRPVTTTGPGVAVGVFVPFPHTVRTSFAPVSALLDRLHWRPAILQGFYDWQRATGQMIPFPADFASYAAAHGAVPMITWQPAQGQVGTAATAQQPAFALSRIASGAYDGYLTQYATAVKAYRGPVYLRLMHEMNGSYYPWGAGVDGNTPAEYVTAFRHVVDIFRRVGATNAQFVWCVAAQVAGPPLSGYFPGDRYVDWVAMDGYNRDLGGTPKSFAAIFGPDYRILTALSSRPVMVAETGSVEDPTDPTAKARWITDAFASIPTSFPRMKAVVFFDGAGHGYTYPLTSSPAALSAFATALAGPDLRARAATRALQY